MDVKIRGEEIRVNPKRGRKRYSKSKESKFVETKIEWGFLYKETKENQL